MDKQMFKYSSLVKGNHGWGTQKESLTPKSFLGHDYFE